VIDGTVLLDQLLGHNTTATRINTGSKPITLTVENSQIARPKQVLQRLMLLRFWWLMMRLLCDEPSRLPWNELVVESCRHGMDEKPWNNSAKVHLV
jgi:hypothetical protein